MDERPPKGRSAGRRTLRVWLRRLLLLPLPPHGTRLLDVVVLFLGIPVALVVCIPILTIAALASIPIGSLLVAIDAPAVVGGIFALVWFGGALALCFFALLRIYRRLPATMRALVAEETVAEEATLASRPAPPTDDAPR